LKVFAKKQPEDLERVRYLLCWRLRSIKIGEMDG